MMTVTVPFERSYWVEPGKLLAGAYPGDKRLDVARVKLQALLDGGIRTIISLMEEDETNWQGDAFEPYEESIQALAEDKGLEVACLRMPIEDVNVPSSEAMKKTLDAIDDSLAHGNPVYVHCWGGKGRTGTVVGCWLARHGKANGSEALSLIQELRRNDPTRLEPSPETERQRLMVRSWKLGE
jgi:protein tyrosine/serine phosphatase